MIYISLCALPDRIELRESFSQCINALINQNTELDYKILVNIPNKFINYEEANISEWFLELCNNTPKIQIIRDDIDYGPISNILYPLKHVSMSDDDILIVCDDDHLYHEDLIRYHVHKLNQYPENHCICFRGNDPREMRTWYNSNNKKIGKLYPSCVLFPTRHDIYLRFPDHWHSVSYRKKLLKEDIFDQEFLDMTWNNDILMGYYGWTHNFYFLCANYGGETDYRPVNNEGKGSHSFPIVKPLPNHSNSGCNRWRAKPSTDIWTNSKFTQGMAIDKGEIILS